MVREKRQIMELRFVRHFGLAAVECHADIPENVRQMLAVLPYKSIVNPLLCHEYENNKLSFGSLALKFSLPKSTVNDMINDHRAKTRPKVRTETGS